MERWGVGRREYVEYEDEHGNRWQWALCEVSDCPNNVCRRMNDRFCWPHLLSGGAPEHKARKKDVETLTD